MRHRCRSFLSCTVLMFLFGAPAVLAQTTVRGTVYDADTEQPLPGVSVSVQGTTLGTITGVEGRYELELPPNRDRLLFSFVGFRSAERTVPPQEGEVELDVRLEEDVLGLEEVVVTGLATTVKRSNLAHSVATVSARELAEVTTSQTLDGALSGKIPGALITSYSGAPGGGLSVKLRGISTINGNSQPLYIVDGVIVDNSAIQSGVDAVTNATGGGGRTPQDNPVNRIADLNPDDIESIEILKGASAAAIYGARASNGVVIIRTKRGQAGETRVRFAQTLGQASISNRLGTRAFTEETAVATYAPDPAPDATPEQVQAALARQAQIRELFRQGQQAGFYDYEDALYGHDGLLSTSTLSVSGGNEQTRFFVSGLWKDDEGIVARTGYEKQSVRANVVHELSSKADLTVTSNYVRSRARRGLTGNDNSGTTFGVSLAATPNFVDLFPDEDGTFPDHPFNTANPLQTRDLFENQETVSRFIGSGQFTYNFIQTGTQALRAVLEGGVDSYALENEAIFPVELQFERLDTDGRGSGTSLLREAGTLTTNWRGILVHTYVLPGPNVSFTSQGGLTGTDFDQNSLLFTADGLVPGQSNLDQASSLTSEQTQQFQNDRSFFLQEEVNFDNRLIATAGLRGDRSSLNGDVDVFNLYPKASLALNLTNFPFWNVAAVDLFKLRAAFGQTGNIAGFGIKFTSFDPVAIGGNVGTLIARQRGFEDVEPERQTEIEAGLDLSVLDGRASLEFTAYRKLVENQLLLREVEPSTGFGLETFNGGELVNLGLETGLTLLPFNRERFRWLSRTSFWTNRAEVTELPVPAFDAVGGGFGSTLGTIRIEEGKSPTQIVGIDDRLVQITDENDMLVTLGPGADGTPDGTFQLGDVAPDFQMSFYNEFSFLEGFTLTIFGHWKKGGDVLNLSELLFDLLGTSPDFDAPATFRRHVPADEVVDLEEALAEGDLLDLSCAASPYEGFRECVITDEAGQVRVGQLGVSATPFVQNASYFRIREIGLYYSLPPSLLQNALGSTLRAVRIGVSAKNPITITPYKSYDPEVNNFGTQPVATGVEVLPYPSFKSFLFHLSVDL